DSLEFHSPRIRLRYEALNRPAQVRQLTLADGQQQVLKQTPVLGPFDPDAYVSQRLWATAGDGTQAAIAEVPFVDVLNTMLDPDLPLTVTEYDEWGNPQEPEVHARIKAYAPYENVKAQAYPALLVVAGYNDSRVQ
uniref:Prolyl endopeptidase n=1 Tax=Steinernema glaseri TaxID=37863 RepID=A0A1I8AHN7_9BILA